MSMTSVVSTERGTPMSTTMNQTHIAYDLLDSSKPAVVVIAFETHDLTDPTHGKELGEELDSLICPDLPMRFVLDFEGVRAMGSTAFCEIAAFARRVRWWGGQVTACNLDPSLTLGAASAAWTIMSSSPRSASAAVAMARSARRPPRFRGLMASGSRESDRPFSVAFDSLIARRNRGAGRSESEPARSGVGDCGGRGGSASRRIHARTAETIDRGSQMAQSTAQSVMALRRSTRAWTEADQVRAIWVGKSAATGGGG